MSIPSNISLRPRGEFPGVPKEIVASIFSAASARAVLLSAALACSMSASFAQGAAASAPSVEQPASASASVPIGVPASVASGVVRCSDPANAGLPECKIAEEKIKSLAKESKKSSGASAKALAAKYAANKAKPFDRQDLVMYAGEVIVLNVGVLDRVAIGNGKIASSTVLDDDRILIIAQDVGDTNILLWNKGTPMRDIRLRVTAQNMDRVKRETANLLAEIPGLKIASVGDRIFIEGYDLSDTDLERVKALAAQYPSIIDRTVGKARPPKAADPSTMIMFDLYFVEFKKTFLQNLGVSWQRSFNGFNVGLFGETARGPLLLRPNIGGENGVTFTPPLPNTRQYGLSAAANVALSVPATINLAVDNGDAVLLAAPKIATRSGGKAKFTAGGEIPLPSSSLQGTNVTFKPYGILLEVEPTINADGTVSGVVRAEVSGIDPAVTVLGIPGFLTRRTEADFFSKSGEAVVLSGLYSQELSKGTQKVPLLGELPLLGALFSSNDETRKNSELVVFIVPHVHSASSPMNEKILQNTRNMVSERTRALSGDGTDVLPKMRPSSQVWGTELLGGPAANPAPPAPPPPARQYEMEPPPTH